MDSLRLLCLLLSSRFVFFVFWRGLAWPSSSFFAVSIWSHVVFLVFFHGLASSSSSFFLGFAVASLRKLRLLMRSRFVSFVSFIFFKPTVKQNSLFGGPGAGTIIIFVVRMSMLTASYYHGHRHHLLVAILYILRLSHAYLFVYCAIFLGARKNSEF